MHGWLRLRLSPLTEGILARTVTAALALLSVVMLLVIQKLGGVLGEMNIDFILKIVLFIGFIIRMGTKKFYYFLKILPEGFNLLS